MEGSTRTVAAGILCVLGVLVLGSAVRAQDANGFHSDRFGYTLTVPDGWVPIDIAVLEEMVRRLVQPGARVRYDAAFQEAGPTDTIAYPYMLVQVMPYSDWGIHRQVREADFADIVKQLSGADTEQMFRRAIRPESADLFDLTIVSSPVVDAEQRRYMFDVDFGTDGAGEVRGRAFGMFGRETVIQVLIADMRESWPTRTKVCETISSSLRFDEAFAYDPSGNSILNNPIVSGVLAGVVAGGLCGLGYTLLAKRRRKKLRIRHDLT